LPGLPIARLSPVGIAGIADCPVGIAGIACRVGAGIVGIAGIAVNAGSLAIGDIDKDGDPDVPVGTFHDVSVLRNTGWQLGPPFRLAGDPPQGIALGDLDRDGALDAVWGSGGHLNVLRGP